MERNILCASPRIFDVDVFVLICNAHQFLNHKTRLVTTQEVVFVSCTALLSESQDPLRHDPTFFLPRFVPFGPVVSLPEYSSGASAGLSLWLLSRSWGGRPQHSYPRYTP